MTQGSSPSQGMMYVCLESEEYEGNTKEDRERKKHEIPESRAQDQIEGLWICEVTTATCKKSVLRFNKKRGHRLS